MLTFIETERADAVAVSVDGKITRDDYNTLMPVIESKVQQYGQIPVLVRVGELDEDAAKNLMKDLGLDKDMLKQFSRLAVVTANQTYIWGLRMAKFFLPVKIKVFTPDEEAEALAWMGA